MTQPQDGASRRLLRLHLRARHSPECPPVESERDFEALTLPHAAALYRMAYHLTGAAVEAEDLTQETYLRAYRAFTEFRGGDARSWLFTILRHAFLDECRRQARRPAIVSELAEASLFGNDAGNGLAPSAEYEALRRLPTEAIERAFASLPPESRMVVVLADVEELSYREIAAVMGIPVGTVMSRLHRARKRLQQQLRDTPAAKWKPNARSA